MCPLRSYWKGRPSDRSSGESGGGTILEPGQRLVADDPITLEIHDRLEDRVEGEAIEDVDDALSCAHRVGPRGEIRAEQGPREAGELAQAGMLSASSIAADSSADPTASTPISMPAW